MHAILLRFQKAILVASVLLSGAFHAQAQVSGVPARGNASDPLDLLESCIISVIPVGKQVVDEAVRPIYDQIKVSPSDEMAVGLKISKEVIRQHRGLVDVNPRDLAYVRAVGQRVALGVRNKGIRYTFHLIEKETVNAFAHCGGHIYIFRGLLKRLKNEAQLGSVLGHEIAHVDLGHTSEVIKAFVLAGQIQSVLPFVSVDTARFLAMTAQRVVGALYGEPQEIEADEAGLKLAFHAGYDPAEGAQYWKDNPDINRGQGRLGNVGQAVLRSHPSALQRAQLTEKVSRDLKQLADGKTLVIGVENFNHRIPPVTR